jgi:prevent-host-death family protein
MKETVLTVTQAARNFAECVNQAHYKNVAFVLVKNGKPVARIVPGVEKACTGRELAEAVAKAQLSPREAQRWHRDITTARKGLQSPPDKWR